MVVAESVVLAVESTSREAVTDFSSILPLPQLPLQRCCGADV